jgi:hypothetical protein
MTIKIEGKMSNGLDIRICRTPEDFDLGRKVSQDYAHWLQEPSCTKSFDQEMTEFESYYSLPQGLFLLAELDGKIAGGVGLHKTDFFTGKSSGSTFIPIFAAGAWGSTSVRNS